MNPQTAKLDISRPCKFNSTDRREGNGVDYEYAALVPSRDKNYRELRSVVTLRIYATKSRHYACVWINGDREDHHRNGSARAGGYGYHRASQAAECALMNCGFRFSKPIGGTGEQSIREAVLACAAAIGFKKANLHVAHA